MIHNNSSKILYKTFIDIFGKIDLIQNSPTNLFSLYLNKMDLNNLIIFDGVCNLCNASVQFIINRDKKRVFKFLPLQSERTGEIFKQFNIDFENLDTIILIKNKKVFVRSDAALEIANALDYPWKIFYFLIFIPKFIRDRIYNIIANNRYDWFGKRENCMIPTEDMKSRFLD